MKIVQVLESCATGTLSMVCLIANRFANDGHEVHVVYSIRDETPNALRTMFDNRVILKHIQMQGRGLFFAIARLRATLVEIQPDVIHLHSSVAGFLGRLATLFSCRRSIILYSPHCIAFMRQDISRFARSTYIALERLASMRKAVYVACSESECHAVWAYLRKRAVVVENAVSEIWTSEHGSLHQCGRASSGFRCIVTVGGIRRQKNPELFARIASTFRDSNLRFVWVGDGEEKFKQQLVDAGVRVTGWVSREDVIRNLEQASIYLSTASWEGMPVSVIEAMLTGLPVVVSACAGNVDVVRGAVTGVVFNNEIEAINAIKNISDNDVWREDLANRGRCEARRRFSEDRFFEVLIPLYLGRVVATRT
ncbi:glycosyltransferase family 4 protein [Paraburkholderia sp. Tr-20389]|uniref:glycosyltransferase n=1 Tax=Paraburkholderia sp. Tr-20389 TaxID=2703903 RepID=UPI0019815CDB|nr:glycosyltransferase [Paraburkholderia sp. Tr-20389]MBN3756909.1 glycosyltransferase family 4 protein [Paraburkholderia sp. Tr-20389]